MREISATVSADYTLEAGASQGYTGESNAEQLTIDLGPFAQDGFDCYYLYFDTSSLGGRFSSDPVTGAEDSPAYLDGDRLCCPLTERLTSTGRLRVQLEGQKTENGRRMMKKTSIATFYFRPSIMPAGAVLGESGYDRLAEMEAAVAQLRGALEALAAEPGQAQATELAALSARIDALDAALTALADTPAQADYELPAATADTLGGVKVAATNTVIADENGRLEVNLFPVDWKAVGALLIASLFAYGDGVELLIDNGKYSDEELQRLFEDKNMMLIDGNSTSFLFVPARNGYLTLLDENYDEHRQYISKSVLLLLQMQNGVLTQRLCSGESLRQLLVQGL